MDKVNVEKFVDGLEDKDDVLRPEKLYPHNVKENRLQVVAIGQKVYNGSMVKESMMHGMKLLQRLDRAVERGERTGDVDTWLNELDEIGRQVGKL